MQLPQLDTTKSCWNSIRSKISSVVAHFKSTFEPIVNIELFTPFGPLGGGNRKSSRGDWVST